MNDKQKQIEEINKTLRYIVKSNIVKTDNYEKFAGWGGHNTIFVSDIAKDLYNANCRILDKGSVVLSKEEREELNDTIRGALKREEKWRNLCDVKAKELGEARKQAVKEFAEKLKEKAKTATYIDKTNHIDITEYFLDVEELAKEFGVEVEE